MSDCLADIKAVSFDLDDTFWDCAPAIHRAERSSYLWLSRQAPRITRHHSEESLRDYRADFHRSRPDLHGDVTAMRRASFAALFKEFDYPAELTDAAFDVFYRSRSEVQLYAGVHELLAALQPRYHLAAITNGNADLSLIGIEHYFHSIHHASLEQTAKPATVMFDACLKRFALPATALLHVGDSPHSDVAGAHNAGASACWYNPHAQPWPAGMRPPRIEVRSLGELQRLLAGERAH